MKMNGVPAITSILAFLLVLLLDGAHADPMGRYGRDPERRHREEEGRRGYAESRFRDLQPRRPKLQFKSPGGQYEQWNGEQYEPLIGAEMAAARFTLNPRGLMVPAYIDGHSIKVVTKGRAWMGLVLPIGDRVIHRHVYRVQTGDVVAIPRGVPAWWYNDDSEPTEIIGIADTTSGEEAGFVQCFELAGGSQGRYPNVLRGFDPEMLARAWDVDRGTVHRLLESQNETLIVQAREGIRMPEIYEESNTFFANFIYRLESAAADVRVENGGELRIVNSYKLPALKYLELGMTCVKLEPNAIVTPGWSMNAHTLIYIVGGSGRIQIVRHNGEKALDTEVREGSLVLVPRNYPVVKRAGKDGLEYLAVLTSDCIPLFQQLAGRYSVYNGMPEGIVAASWNIDRDLVKQLKDRRREEAYIFPQRRGGEPRDNKVEAASSELLRILGFSK